MLPPRELYTVVKLVPNIEMCVGKKHKKGLTKITSVILHHLVYMWTRNTM